MPVGRRFRCLEGAYAICRVPAGADVSWAVGELRVVIEARGEALATTVICDEASVPAHVERDDGWRVIRFEGVFDFSEVGVLSEVLSTLADARVPVMTVSSFETDYLLIKAVRFDRVRQVLQEAGHAFVENGETP